MCTDVIEYNAEDSMRCNKLDIKKRLHALFCARAREKYQFPDHCCRYTAACTKRRRVRPFIIPARGF